MATAADVKDELRRLATPGKAGLYRRFFKTGKGQYGEGDIFIGTMMPENREVAQQYKALSRNEIQKLLDSKIHEHRMTGLLILAYQYKEAEKEQNTKSKEAIYEFYMRNLRAVNNWDLVDVTVPNVVGNFIYEKASERKRLFALARSKNLWERRVAVLATFSFIKKHEFDDALRLCALLLDDKHDLMHKACGWMLREIGKRDEHGAKALRNFLDKNATRMARTMLRYAIERFPEKERKRYLALKA